METEKKPQAKKEWKTPELIVLVRSNPEEAVLLGCKDCGLAGAGTHYSCCMAGLNCDWVCQYSGPS
jgi:hypothetical protein